MCQASSSNLFPIGRFQPKPHEKPSILDASLPLAATPVDLVPDLCRQRDNKYSVQRVSADIMLATVAWYLVVEGCTVPI